MKLAQQASSGRPGSTWFQLNRSRRVEQFGVGLRASEVVCGDIGEWF